LKQGKQDADAYFQALPGYVDIETPTETPCETFRFVVRFHLEKRNAVAKRAFRCEAKRRNETLNQSYFAVSFRVAE